jgi:hypothetical protein
MKCPHCEYEHDPHGGEWNEQEGRYINPKEGKEGNFYELPVKMERTYTCCRYYDNTIERIALYACPSCMKTFVDG